MQSRANRVRLSCKRGLKEPSSVDNTTKGVTSQTFFAAGRHQQQTSHLTLARSAYGRKPGQKCTATYAHHATALCSCVGNDCLARKPRVSTMYRTFKPLVSLSPTTYEQFSPQSTKTSYSRAYIHHVNARSSSLGRESPAYLFRCYYHRPHSVSPKKKKKKHIRKEKTLFGIYGQTHEGTA